MSYSSAVFPINCCDGETQVPPLSFSRFFLSLLWHFPHNETFFGVISGRNQLRGCLQLLSWTLSCFINATQSRSYHSINTTCWSRARPVHRSTTVSSVSARQPVLSWLALLTRHSSYGRDCVVSLSMLSSVKRRRPG